MRFRVSLQNIIQPLVEYRFLLSLGLSAACGIVLNSMFPIDATNPSLQLIEVGAAAGLSDSRLELQPVSVLDSVLIACSMSLLPAVRPSLHHGAGTRRWGTASVSRSAYPNGTFSRASGRSSPPTSSRAEPDSTMVNSRSLSAVSTPVLHPSALMVQKWKTYTG